MSKKVQKVLIPILLIGTAIGAVGFLSKGFKDWNIDSNFNSIKDSLFPTSSSEVDSSSETSSEQQLIHTNIDFKSLTGITGTIGKQRTDITNNKYVVYSNQARIYSGKFIVGKTDGDQTSAFADANTLQNLVPLYDEVGNIVVKEVSGAPVKATWMNYVDIQTGLIDSAQAVSLKFTYTFDYGSSTNFRIEPFCHNVGDDSPWTSYFANLDSGFDRTTYQYITYQQGTSTDGKVVETVSINLVPFGGTDGLAGGFYDSFGIAIFGVNSDTRLTVNSMELVTTEETPAHGTAFDYYTPVVPQGVNVVDQKGITIKNVATGTDTNQHSYVVINYVLSPVNTTDNSIVANTSWVNTSITDDESLFLATEVNTELKTLKVTCLQAFSNQMKVVLSSQNDPTKTSTITFDVAQKFLGFKEQQDLFIPHYFGSLAIQRNFKSDIPQSILVDRLTNGFTSVFTTGISTAATVTNYHYDSNSEIQYSDEWNSDYLNQAEAAFTQDDRLPTLSQCVQSTALIDDTFDTYSTTSIVAKTDLVTKINNDAAAHWTTAQIDFVKNSATYFAIKTSAHFDLTVGGITNNIRVDYFFIVATADLTLNIPLQSIQPEVSNFTF